MRQVHNPPSKPLLIYDGDCGFCLRWVRRWQDQTGDLVDYAPFQRVAAEFPEIPQEEFLRSVQLVETSGEVRSGAEAVFRALAHLPRKRWLLWAYQKISPFRHWSEQVYRFVAERRSLFSNLTLFLWGKEIFWDRTLFTRWLFLRLLALVYLIAFASLGTQILGLVGSQGILPVPEILSIIGGGMGPERYFTFPTLCWLFPTDRFLLFLCWGGAFLSVLLVLGVAEVPILLLLWLFYLSLTTVSVDFLSFQWDTLLLETGFLAIFFAPFKLRSQFAKGPPPSKMVLWLFRWLAFRLTFSSGIVKLASGDPTWRNLTALQYHYETQPLPTWTSWYVHQLPAWFQKFSVLMMFGVELILPFLIFAPRRLRFFATWGMMGLQLLILGTGNYGFFNLLTLLLYLLLLDDACWPRSLTGLPSNEVLLGGRCAVERGGDIAKRSEGSPVETGPGAESERIHQKSQRVWPRWVIFPVGAMILLVSTTHLTRILQVRVPWPEPIKKLRRTLAPFHIVGSYGLFAIMTTTRPEIIVQGSRGGLAWVDYEFKYKPGDPKRKPRFVAPHQPRLDWQMWFAALSDYRENPWFLSFSRRLLEGSAPVLRLLKNNPFPDEPPQFIRAVIYDYRFTHPKARRETGAWWHRIERRLYCPVLSLEEAPKGRE